MNRRIVLTDVAIAVVAAVLILLLTPGLAISGVIGLVVLLALALTWLIERWRGRARRYRQAALQGRRRSH